MSNLYQASNQWATRPADERFWTVQDMLEQCNHYRDSARESQCVASGLVADYDGEEMVVQRRGGHVVSRISNWGFGQLCGLAGAPAGYLRQLPAKVASNCLAYGLKESRDDRPLNLLFHSNGSGVVLRAATSERYQRVWNADVCGLLADLPEQWRVPPARPSGQSDGVTRVATQEDVMQRGGLGGLSVKIGDTIAPAGLYASDHDMFAFMVNESRQIEVAGSSLARGFFLSNSEVGAAALKLTTFLYDYVCGNHIVWGARDVKEVSLRHVGEIRSRYQGQMVGSLTSYADASVSRDLERISAARRLELGKNFEEVSDKVYSATTGLTRPLITTALQRAEKGADRYGSPYSAWGVANGLTEVSQETSFADRRVAIDRAAGRVLQLAF